MFAGELTEKVEAATSSYSATGNFLRCCYSVLVAKNHQKFRSNCLVHEFSFTDIFIDINHGYSSAILKKNSLWLLPFFMAVATYFYYEKVGRTMRTGIVWYLLKVAYRVQIWNNAFFQNSEKFGYSFVKMTLLQVLTFY